MYYARSTKHTSNTYLSLHDRGSFSSNLCVVHIGAREWEGAKLTSLPLDPHSDVNEEDLFPSWTTSADVLTFWRMVPVDTSASF